MFDCWNPLVGYGLTGTKPVFICSFERSKYEGRATGKISTKLIFHFLRGTSVRFLPFHRS